MNSARDTLNRARWRDSDLNALRVTVIHRGAPNDQRTLEGSRIVAIRREGIELAPEHVGAETTFVPYHRFLAICDAQGAPLWERHKRPEPPSATLEAEPPHEPREISPTFSVVVPSSAELVIDGAAGEGGGQILRTSLALSLLTGRPFALERIRAGRAKPGLMRQHLASVHAAAAIGSASVEGAELGSTRLTFRPQRVRGGDYEFDIGSAGSAALVVQTIALPLALAEEEAHVVVRGGTHAPWAPIFPFLERAWLPPVRYAGADIALALRRTGFYPVGGGEIVLRTAPSGRLLPLRLAPRSDQLELALTGIVSGLPETIAQRELAAAAELLGELDVSRSSAKVKSPGPGNAVWLAARDGINEVENVFSAVGERGVPAEEVGRAVASAFLAWRASGASVEQHLADQLMLPMALAGEGSYTTHELTLHSRTNVEVIHAFTGRRLRVWELAPSCYRIEL